MEPVPPTSAHVTGVCGLLLLEDVGSRTVAIRIEAGSIRGQRRALWVEAALPLLRENIEKPLDQQLMLRGASEHGVLLEG